MLDGIPLGLQDSEMTVASRIHFDHPPITEVVCGVGFPSVAGLGSAHLGLLWQRWANAYPVTSDQPSLPPLTDGNPAQLHLHLETSRTPRVWFASDDGRQLLQVQPNRFHHNWRKLGNDVTYPRFPTVYDEFRRRLNDFTAFLVEGGASVPVWELAELCYLNRIPLMEDSKGTEDIGTILPDLVWHRRRGRALRAPDQQSWEARFPLSDGRGALWVTARPARDLESGARVLALDLTARGGPGEEGLDAWFAAAHDTIVSGFLDLTSEHTQRTRWARREGGEA